MLSLESSPFRRDKRLPCTETTASSANLTGSHQHTAQFDVDDIDEDYLLDDSNWTIGKVVNIDTFNSKELFAVLKELSAEARELSSTRVNAEDTPKMLEKEDGDQIDVLLQQLGGADTEGAPAAENV